MNRFFGLIVVTIFSLSLSAREIDPKLQKECLSEGNEILEENYAKFVYKKLDLLYQPNDKNNEYQKAFEQAAVSNEKLIRSYCGKIKNKLDRKALAHMDSYIHQNGEIDYYMKYVNRVKRYCNEPNRLINEINHFMFDELNNSPDTDSTFFGGTGRLKRQLVETCNDHDEYESSFFVTSTPNFKKLKADIFESRKKVDQILTPQYQTRVTEEIHARFNYAAKIINDAKLYKEAKEKLNLLILDDPDADPCLKSKIAKKMENAQTLYQDMNKVVAGMTAALLKKEYEKIKNGINSPQNIELMNTFFEKQAGHMPVEENPLGFKGVVNFDHNEILKYYSPVFIAATQYPNIGKRGENYLDMLIAAGLNVNTPSGPGNLTPLMGVVLNESELEANLSKTTHGYVGKSNEGFAKNFQKLLESGADDRVVNKNGKNILHLLAESQNKEKSQELFQLLKNHSGNHIAETMLKKDTVWGLSPLELFASSTSESDIKIKHQLYSILASEIKEQRLKLEDIDIKSEYIKEDLKKLL